jgi:predicted unusual protein kinase regulating ubiquinone biosynthesis (AarF/ABC1/UbiB family)
VERVAADLEIPRNLAVTASRRWAIAEQDDLFFIQPGGRIALIDFGMVGAIDDRARGSWRA